MANAL